MTSYSLPLNTGPTAGASVNLTLPSYTPSSPANSPFRSSPLLNRLTTVLSSSYTDSDIRYALETLDFRDIHNTPETRRQLRPHVQREVIDCNGRIVQDFGKVAEQLKRIGAVISSLNQICEDLRKHIVLAKQETDPILEEASTLMERRTETRRKQRLLDAFTSHFIIPDEDLDSLISPTEPVDDRFFNLLTRMKQVYHDCQILLGGENQRLGLEVMGQSSKHLNSAYQKLYKWIQNEFKTLNLEDPQMNISIKRGLRVLAERPSLFHSCLDFFAEAREYILSDSFHSALTGATPTSSTERNVKPIEFSAYDPLRYVGDMLAWVHSASVSEREALEALFVTEGDELARGIKAGADNEPWTRIDEEKNVFDGKATLNELVNRDLKGVLRSLRQRVELTIQGYEDPVITFKVAVLLSFYQTTFSNLIGLDSDLVDVINSLEKYTLDHFRSLMQDHLNMLSTDSPNLTPPIDLSVPQFLSDALEVLMSVMRAFEASFGTQDSQFASNTDNKFTPILHSALDPFLDLAKSSSKELLDPTAEVIYHTNILLAVRSTISPFPFACATHLGPISRALSSLRINILEIQHGFFLRGSGLDTLLMALKLFSPLENVQDSPTAEQPAPNLAEIAILPAFQPPALSVISQRLDDFLASALMDAMDNLKRVQNPSLVKDVTAEAVEVFCRDFEFVEGMIIGADAARGKFDVSKTEKESDIVSSIRGVDNDDADDDGSYSLRAVFPRTVGEIRVLLS